MTQPELRVGDVWVPEGGKGAREITSVPKRVNAATIYTRYVANADVVQGTITQKTDFRRWIARTNARRVEGGEGG